MKMVAAILGALIVLIQYPLWIGKGGWLRAWQLETEVTNQKNRNAGFEVRNAALAAEVRDLKQGSEALEERARRELGMVKSDEIFFQYQDSSRSGVAKGPDPQ